MHLTSLIFYYLHLHALIFTYTQLASPRGTFLHLHVLSFTHNLDYHFNCLIMSLFTYCIRVWGVAAYTRYLSQIDRLLRRAFWFGYIQHETSIPQVIKDRDVRLWKSIMGTSSHASPAGSSPFPPLPPLKNRALRGRWHPYQIPRVNTERFKKCFVNRRLFDSK